jgi:crotonobetainyl-CoA:carnitine CoA-transferase CaiB-like acyl-CoA transferase
MSGMNPKMLGHIRVLDLSLFLSGPYGSQILADMGAEVIKVEPGGGDMTRQLPPNFIAGDSAYFHSVNRNKKSIVINYKTPEGLALLKKLAAECDVLLENQKPGGLAEHGVSYEAISAVNPRIVYCSISGFGQDGPENQRPAYDMVIQAVSGGMSLTGEPDGACVRAGIPLADLSAGMYAATAICAALESRHVTGRGRYIDISMLDCQIAMLTYQASYYLASGTVPGRQGKGHESIPSYRSFTARDGRDVVVCANTDRMWLSLCEAAGLQELGAEPDLATRRGRYYHRDRIIGAFDKAFAQKDAQDWVDALLCAGVPVGTVNTVGEALESPQVSWRNMILELTDDEGHHLRVAGNPIKLPLDGERAHMFPPRLAEHTREVLGDLLHLAEEDIAALESRGVVRQHAAKAPP